MNDECLYSEDVSGVFLPVTLTVTLL